MMKKESPWVFSFISGREESSGAILYNPFTSCEMNFDLEGLAVLSSLDGKHSSRQIIRELSVENKRSYAWAQSTYKKTLDELERGFGLSREKRETPLYPYIARPRIPPNTYPSAPKSVTWEITNACNLRCAHCLVSAKFSTSGQPSMTNPCDLIDSGIEKDINTEKRIVASLREFGVFRVTLTGGEPLLHPRILPIIDMLVDAHFGIDIASNGVGVDDALIREIAMRPISGIQISIDGLGSQHDEFRGREGAFAEATQTLSRFREEGLRTSISTTATKANLSSIGDIIDWAYSSGCKAYKAIPFMPSGRGDTNKVRLALDPDDLRYFAETLIRKEAEYKGKMSVYLGSVMTHLINQKPAGACFAREEAYGTTSEDENPMGCAAGQDTLNIAPDGTVSACPFFRDSPIGKIGTEKIWDMWDNASLLTSLRNLDLRDFPEDCKNCEHSHSGCSGGCRAAAFLSTGSLTGKDPACFKKHQDSAL